MLVRGGAALAAAFDHDVAAAHFQLLVEQLGVGYMADGDEHAVDLDGSRWRCPGAARKRTPVTPVSSPRISSTV